MVETLARSLELRLRDAGWQAPDIPGWAEGLLQAWLLDEALEAIAALLRKVDK